MKRIKLTMLPLTLTLALLLTGCGGSSSSNTASATTASSAPAAADTAAEAENYGYMNFEVAEQESQSSSVYQNVDAKLIREASLNVQTTQFDQAVANLEQMVAQMGGYFQSAAVYGGSYRNVNANRSGEYTIRVPAERYEQFLNQTGELGYVTYKNETTQDIGEQYYDTEARLKTQKTKQERLLVLLEKAETMEDIITLESALSEVEYQIEQLSSTLNRYDSLVSFATIYLNLDEVYEVNEETGVTASLGQRIADGLASSGKSLVNGSQDFMVWVAYHIFGIVIFVLFASAAVVTGRRCYKKRKNKISQGNEK